jgi:hypothetical protein
VIFIYKKLEIIIKLSGKLKIVDCEFRCHTKVSNDEIMRCEGIEIAWCIA